MRRRRVPVYLSDDEVDVIEEAAWRREVSRGEWIRGVLVETAKATIEETGGNPSRHPRRRGLPIPPLAMILASTTTILALGLISWCPVIFGVCLDAKVPLIHRLHVDAHAAEHEHK